MDLILFSIVMFIDLTYIIHVYWYFKDLEHFYPEVYIKIGSPFGSKTKPHDKLFHFMDFLQGKYNHLLDKRFAQGRKYVIIHLVITLIAFISFIIVGTYFEASSQILP